MTNTCCFFSKKEESSTPKQKSSSCKVARCTLCFGVGCICCTIMAGSLPASFVLKSMLSLSYAESIGVITGSAVLSVASGTAGAGACMKALHARKAELADEQSKMPLTGQPTTGGMDTRPDYKTVSTPKP